jgi:hypothetical protein
MDEFFDLGTSTGIVELHIASEIIGLTIDELRVLPGYFTIDYDTYFN